MASHQTKDTRWRLLGEQPQPTKVCNAGGVKAGAWAVGVVCVCAYVTEKVVWQAEGVVRGVERCVVVGRVCRMGWRCGEVW